MHAGTVLACDTPAQLMASRGTDDLEAAFIGYITDATRDAPESKNKDGADADVAAPATAAAAAAPAHDHDDLLGFSLGRLLAYSRREAQEIERDPVRLLFAFVGSALMMLAFGFGITTDVENIRFSYLDLDRSPESRAYLAAFEGSRYFVLHTPGQTPEEMERRLESHEIEVAWRSRPTSAETSIRAIRARSPPGSMVHLPTAPRASSSTSRA